MLLKIYEKEKYILVVNQQEPTEFEVFVSFKVCTSKLLVRFYWILVNFNVEHILLLQEGATSLTVLRSVWQTYWLYQNWAGLKIVVDQLEQSLTELENRFDNFLQQLKEAGWDTNQINLKVPKEISIEEPHEPWLISLQEMVVLILSRWRFLRPVDLIRQPMIIIKVVHLCWLSFERWIFTVQSISFSYSWRCNACWPFGCKLYWIFLCCRDLILAGGGWKLVDANYFNASLQAYIVRVFPSTPYF